METTVKLDRGLFLWYELMTSDKKAAMDFYTNVIGWKTQDFDWDGEAEQPYSMWLAGETAVGGIMQIEPSIMGDMPPHWRTFISVPNVDGAVKKAKDLGGSVIVEPFDVPKVGRMAFLADPQGAMFAVYKPSEEPANRPWPPPKLTFSWHELATTDYESAFSFYRKLFGWDNISDFDMGDDWIYLMYGHGDHMYGGIYDKPAEQPGPPAWLFYVRVDDIDGTVERVKNSGGQLLNGPMEVPGGDLIAQCMDPQGAAFALHQTAN